jgi:hypothetical protein
VKEERRQTAKKRKTKEKITDNKLNEKIKICKGKE